MDAQTAQEQAVRAGSEESKRMKMLVRYAGIGILVFIALLSITITLLGGNHGAGPTVRDVADTASRNWLGIILIAIVLYCLAVFIPNSDPWKELRKTALAGIPVCTIAFILGSNVWVMVYDAFLPKVKCSDISTEVRSCQLNTAWSQWVKIEKYEMGGKRFCRSAGVKSERREVNGNTLFRFRSKDDEGATVKYQLVPPETNCSDIKL